MSVEALTCALLVERGLPDLRKLYAHGISQRDFLLYDDEFRWIERRVVTQKPLNKRLFRAKFPDFEWLTPDGDISDLAQELKEERAFEAITTIVNSAAEHLERDNALDVALQARELLAKVTRAHVPIGDMQLDEYEHVIEEMRNGIVLARQGLTAGIPTGLAHLDHHWGGFMPGQFIEILGRTGEGKSYLMTMFAWAAKKHGYNVGIFSPEQTPHETRCRYHTLASADPLVQRDLNLQSSFRNRALLFRRGFNLKRYERFCKYLYEMPGNVHLLSQAGRAERITVGYVEDRIVEYELNLVLVDPVYLLKPVRLNREGNTYQETAWIAEALHHLSERYQVPVVFSNQAHLDNAKHDAPGKQDSFGAKSLVHLADYVLGVKHISEERRMICRGSKSRFGQTGFRYELGFNPNTGMVEELTPVEGNYFNGDEDGMGEEIEKLVNQFKSER